VLESEGFRERAMGILGASGTELSDRITALSQYGGSLEDTNQSAAISAIADQLRGATSGGELSGEMRTMLRAGSVDERRLDEIRSIRTGFAANYGGMSERLRARGISGRVVNALDASRHIMLGTRDPLEATSNLRNAISSLDTSSSDYSTISEELGRTEEGRALLSAGSSDRHLRREMTGRGRRGAAGAADAALGAVTGGSLSEMEFNIGGRTISGSDRNASRTLMGILRRGDSSSTELIRQLETRLTGMGVSAGDATSMVTTLAAGAANGRGGGLDERTANELMRMTGSNSDLERVRSEGANRMARERDPLGHARNELLTSMNTTLVAIRDRLPAATSSESTGEAS
jgi:hypothetical protein